MSPADFHIYIVSDGSCSSVDRSGGWATVIATSTRQVLLLGAELNTTISRCEIMPILAGLRWVRGTIQGYRGLRIRLVSDSEFVIHTLSGHFERKDGLLMELWAAYDQLADGLLIRPMWTSRNVHPYQQLVDAAASRARRSLLNARTGMAEEPAFDLKAEDMSLFNTEEFP